MSRTGRGMLTNYIETAMRHAKYEFLEEDDIYYGEIPGFQGVWGDGATLEECCQVLREVLEEWIVLGLQLGHSLPVVDGIELKLKKVPVR
jgi:predicted RNase H-like HicB family nuclease